MCDLFIKNLDEYQTLKEEHKLVRDIVEQLPYLNRKIIKMYFGFDDYKIHTLDEICELYNYDKSYISKIFENSLNKIKENLLLSYHIQNNHLNNDYLDKKTSLIYDLFKDYTKEEIEFVLQTLTDREKEIINLIYVEGNNSKIEKKYLWTFYSEIKPKINDLLIKHQKSKQNKTIYALLSDYKKEDIDKVLSNLNDKEKELIRLRYGNDLENPIKSELWDMSLGSRFYSRLIPKVKKKLKK